MIRTCRTTLLAIMAGGMPCAWRPTADTKSEMVGIIDKIAASKPDAESLIDWDNLTVKSPQLATMDVHKLYSGMDAANKRAFRGSFLKSFAASFQQASHGHSFAEAAKTKGVIDVKEKGDHPTMTLHAKQGGKGDLRLGYVRKHGKLLLQTIEDPG